MDYRWRILWPVTLLCLSLGFVACQRAEDADPFGEPNTVRVILGAQRATVGDPVDMRIEAVHTPDVRVELPDPAHGAAFDVRDRLTTTRVLDAERALTSRHYTLVCFQIGSHTATTGTVRFITNHGEIVERTLPETVFEVVSVIHDEETTIRPIKPPVDWPGRIPGWVPLTAGIVLLALALAWLTARILGKQRVAMQQPPPLPPHETALDGLRRLMRKGYIESHDVNPFYTELSDIVRHYLEDRFQLRAPESTTEEFIRDAANARVLLVDHQALVRDFLEQSDRVKFARLRPGISDMKDAYAAAERLVLETARQSDTGEDT